MFRESGNLWIITFLVAVLIITGGCRQQGTEPRTEEGTAAVDYTYFRVGMPEEIYSLDPVEITTYGEMLIARTSERQGRAIDRDEAGSMEKKKREGYF